MLVPLTNTQPARPPRACGRQNHKSAANNASCAAMKATALACRGHSRRAGLRGIVATLVLIAERDRRSLRTRAVAGDDSARVVVAGRVDEHPAVEGAVLDCAVETGGDGE